jgi:hypothetical protein
VRTIEALKKTIPSTLEEQLAEEHRLREEAKAYSKVIEAKERERKEAEQKQYELHLNAQNVEHRRHEVQNLIA